MANERKYDMVVFGASGFTGQYVVDEVAKVAVEENLSWAISGRDMAKLQEVLCQSSKRIGTNVEETPILIADTSSYQSLLEMAQQCKVVLNCVGPYRFYGEDVIKACIESRTNYVDICAEAAFLEKMQLRYNGIAKENEVFVVGSTGFDCIPSEMGISYARKQFDGEVTNIESFLRIQHGPKGHGGNVATFQSVIYDVAHKHEMMTLRKSLYPEPLPKFEYTLPKRLWLFYSEEVKKWCVPFIGIDESVAMRTERDFFATKRLNTSYQFLPYLCQESFFKGIVLLITMLICGITAKFSCGRKLLVKYSHVFTLGAFKKGGVSKAQIDETSFSMTFVTRGYKEGEKDHKDKTPDKIIKTKIVAPEAGYVTTPICMVQCAVTLLKERNRLFHKGGVYSPGAVFEGTTLIERLGKHNVKFMKVE